MRLLLRTLLRGTAALGVLLAPSRAQAQTIPSAYAFLEAKKEAGPVLGYMSAATGRFSFGPSGGAM